MTIQERLAQMAQSNQKASASAAKPSATDTVIVPQMSVMERLAQMAQSDAPAGRTPIRTVTPLVPVGKVPSVYGSNPLISAQMRQADANVEVGKSIINTQPASSGNVAKDFREADAENLVFGQLRSPTTPTMYGTDPYIASQLKATDTRVALTTKKVQMLTGTAKRDAGNYLNGISLVGRSLDDTGGDAKAKAQRIADLEAQLEDPNINAFTRAYLMRQIEDTRSWTTVADVDTQSKKLLQGGAEDLADAKYGLGKTGKSLVDIGSGAVSLAADIAFAAATGVTALAPMALRSFGGAAYQAEQAGATVGQQLLYGTASAATSLLVEKISNVGGLLSKAYGKGILDKALANAASRIPARMLKAGLGEGFEEVLEATLDPLWQRLTYNKAASWDAENILYQGLIGAILGSVAGGVGGGNAQVQTEPQSAKVVTPPTTPSVTVSDAPQSIVAPTPVLTPPTVQNAHKAAKTGSNTAQTQDVAVPVQEAAQDTALPEGTGAASAGFNGTVERGFSENVSTDKAMQPDIREDFQLDPEMYNRLANKETLVKAEKIFAQGIDTARSTVEQAIGAAKGGAKLSPEMVPLARMVANELAAKGDLTSARFILSDIAVELTQAGQLGQAANILRQTDAATVLETVRKQIEKINEAGRKKYGKKWKDFDLTEDEMQAIGKINPGDTVAMQAIIKMVGKRIGAEMPSTNWQKITEFRRIAMLLNPKTQVRNILGNVPLAGLRKMSETLSAAVQDAAVHMGYISKADQTRTLKVSAESKAVAQELFKQYKDVLLNADKWDLKSVVSEYQTVFKNVPMEKVREFTYWLLQKGDMPFLKSAFVDNAAGYIQAQGYKTAYDVPQKVIDMASKEALAATFRDASALAQWMNGLKRNSGAAGAAFDVLFPFTTTPINIARRTVDYSPLGALKLLNVSNRASAAQVIDTITKSVTGSGILFLGFLLSKLGWITGGQDKDRDKAQFMLATGKQPYSIMGKYSYDWIQPVGTQLAIGAEIWKAVQGDTSLGKAIMNSVISGGDAMLNLTFFSNVMELFNTYGSVTQNTAETLATGFASQLVPALLGQTARTGDTSVRSTYTGKGLLPDIMAQTQAKLPWFATKLPESVDVRGDTKARLGNPLLRALEQFVSPGQINANQQNAVDEEIQRVYDQTGDAAVFPKYALGYFTTNGTKYTMTGDERSQFQKTLGAETYSGFDKLFKSKDYREASDAEKAELMAKVITEANDTAKQNLVESRGEMYLPTANDVEKFETYVAAGVPEKQAYSLYKTLDALQPETGKERVSDLQRVTAISKQPLTDKQKTALVTALYTSHDKDGNVTRESLLSATPMASKLLQRYLATQNSDFINMGVPESFTDDKIEYVLTAAEKETYRTAYLEYLRLRLTATASDDAILKKLKKAAEEAQEDIIRGR